MCSPFLAAWPISPSTHVLRTPLMPTATGLPLPSFVVAYTRKNMHIAGRRRVPFPQKTLFHLQALLVQRFVFVVASLFLLHDNHIMRTGGHECSSPGSRFVHFQAPLLKRFCFLIASLFVVHAVHSMCTGGHGWVLLPKKPPLHLQAQLV